MFVLFDQGTPVPIRPFLKEHPVRTTAQRSWDKLKNGELLKAAEDAGFDVLVTPRQKYPLPAEFNGSHNRARRAGQSAMANTAPALRLHVERVVTAVNAARPGSYTEVEIPER